MLVMFVVMTTVSSWGIWTPSKSLTQKAIFSFSIVLDCVAIISQIPYSVYYFFGLINQYKLRLSEAKSNTETTFGKYNLECILQMTFHFRNYYFSNNFIFENFLGFSLKKSKTWKYRMLKYLNIYFGIFYILF